MIDPQSYTEEWIEYIVRKHEANAYDLAEKMIYAMTLLEQLKIKGLTFIFKGGTSLVLMFQKFHRFSKDIDILMPEKLSSLPTTFDQIIRDSPFIRWELNERKNDEFQVPKEHYKFYYNPTRPGKYKELPILLDIIYIQSTYPRTQALPINSFILQSSPPYEDVVLPTILSITGDKLTAFAPNTIGIPANKKKDIEIAKQLFDLHGLYDHVTDIDEVKQSFVKTATAVARHYRKDLSPDQVCDDIITTARVMAMNGKENLMLFNEIKSGVAGLSSYLSRKTPFGWNIAVLAAARIAHLAACLKRGSGFGAVALNDFDPKQLKEMKIDYAPLQPLNKKLKAGYPEAWLYWYHTANLLSE